MTRSVLVLAGGRSRRFGQDKLSLDWQGRALRDHVVNRMRELSDDVIVLAARSDGAADHAPPGVRVVRDRDDWPGPLVAVAAGLAEARHDQVLIVAADMPVVPIRVLELLLSAAEAPGRTLVGLVHDDEVQALPVVVRRDAAMALAEDAIAAGSRRLGALRDLPGAHGILEESWRALDPRGDSLRDIDTTDDLTALLRELEIREE